MPAGVTTGASGGWVEHAERALRRSGHRASGPRSAVVEVLGRQDCVLTAREVADELRAEGRDVGLATVYRALELLAGMGLVKRLDMGTESARYEPADPSGEHHHHFVCDRCGRVSQFEDDGLERAIARVARRLDHRVGGHEVVLHGDCSACA